MWVIFGRDVSQEDAQFGWKLLSGGEHLPPVELDQISNFHSDFISCPGVYFALRV